MSSSRSFRQLRLQRTNSNARTSISLTTPSALSTTYRLTLPNALPSSSQALLSDATGALSWGSISAAATQNTFSGANNVTTPTNVTGLVVSTSPSVVPVYVYVNATAKLAAVVNLSVYSNPAISGYSIDGVVVGDDVQVDFTISSSGQILYTSPNYPGFVSLTLTWFSPYTPVTSVTSSLSLTSSLSVGTNSSFGTNPISGTPTATTGGIINIRGATFTDVSTAASGTLNSFHGSYIGAPILSATNTGITTSTANTLTIAGPPTAGSNETITNAFALNVASGNTFFGGNVTMNGTLPLLYANQPYGTFSMNMNSFNTSVQTIQFTYASGNIGTGVTTASSGIPITITGLYMISHGFEASNVTEYVLYLNTPANTNRLMNRFDNGAAFPDSRHAYATVALIPAGSTLGSYVSVNASTTLTNIYSKGLVVTLLTRMV